MKDPAVLLLNLESQESASADLWQRTSMYAVQNAWNGLDSSCDLFLFRSLSKESFRLSNAFSNNRMHRPVESFVWVGPRIKDETMNFKEKVVLDGSIRHAACFSRFQFYVH